MGKYRIPAFISLQKYLMGDERHTGVNGKARNRDGTWGTAIAISPFSDPRQSPLISHGTLSSTSLERGFRNLILVLRVATIGQMELDLEIKYICNIWFKRKINSEKKKTLAIYISFSEFVNVCETWGKRTLLVLQTYLVHWHHWWFQSQDALSKY